MGFLKYMWQFIYKTSVRIFFKKSSVWVLQQLSCFEICMVDYFTFTCFLPFEKTHKYILSVLRFSEKENLDAQCCLSHRKPNCFNVWKLKRVLGKHWMVKAVAHLLLKNWIRDQVLLNHEWESLWRGSNGNFPFSSLFLFSPQCPILTAPCRKSRFLKCLRVTLLFPGVKPFNHRPLPFCLQEQTAAQHGLDFCCELS